MRSLRTTLAIVLLLMTSVASASESNGTIDATNFKTKVCHDTTCASPTPGILNLRPTGTTAITIEDTAGLNGIAWGSEIGWVTFNPAGAEQVTVNPATGALTGKAWAQASGWVNFRPNNSGTTALGLPIGVSITNSGEFYGWAWTGGPNGGWIKFDCSNAQTCVKTDWRPTSARGTTVTTTPAPAAAASGPIAGTFDLCANIFGTQATIPVGYVFDGGICIEAPKDACDNLPGFQSGVPQGYVQDTGGMCVLPVDYCSNLDGVQQTVPQGMVIRDDGTCGAPKPIDLTKITLDVNNDGKPGPLPVFRDVQGNPITLPLIFDPSAPNIPDVLKPYTQKLSDRCPNLPGFQEAIPLGFVSDTAGWCVPAFIDYCPNLPGEQTMIPSDLYIDNSGACVSTDERAYLYPTERGKQIAALSFVPHDVRIPIELSPAAKILQSIYHMNDAAVELPAASASQSYPVDLISLLLLLDVAFVNILSIYILARRFLG